MHIVLLLAWLYAATAFLLGFHHTIKHQNPYGLALRFLPLGVFVWGDALVLGAFWSATLPILIWLGDPVLAGLVLSVFWSVRSLGEVVYWLNRQFSVAKREPAKEHLFYRYVKSDAVWFLHQLVWQCVLVISLVGAVYCAVTWQPTVGLGAFSWW